MTLVFEYEVNGLANTVQRTILFLIADTGAGHRSAANAIRNAIAVIAQQEQEAWQAPAAKRYGRGGGETSFASSKLSYRNR